MSRNHTLEDKFLEHGLSTLDDVEVLELLLKVRLDDKPHITLAESLMTHYDTLNQVMDASQEQLSNLPGFNKRYLIGLKLPHEAANRYLLQKAQQNPFIKSSEAVRDYLRHSMNGLKTEHFRVLYLNGRNMLLRVEDLSKGTLNTAAVYPREVMKAALKHDAAALVFAHNHPSGNVHPSQEDFGITEKLCDAGKLLDIVVHDHIIIADNNYYSFSDHGLI